MTERKRVSFNPLRRVEIETALGTLHCMVKLPGNDKALERLHAHLTEMAESHPSWSQLELGAYGALHLVQDMEEVITDMEIEDESGQPQTITIDPGEKGWKRLCRQHLQAAFCELFNRVCKLPRAHAVDMLSTVEDAATPEETERTDEEIQDTFFDESSHSGPAGGYVSTSTVSSVLEPMD